MDNHPIPQDVTGFQFKLIGSMTIKQFAYVAFGVILAVILYYLPLSGFFGVLVKMIFIPLFGGSGFLIAFLPVEGRPVDVMVGNFLKALVSPNQFIYHKTGASMNFVTMSFAAPPSDSLMPRKPSAKLLTSQKSQEKAARLRAFLKTASTKTTSKLDDKESAFLASFSQSAPTLAPIQPNVEPPVTEQPTAKEDALSQQEHVLETELAKAKQEEATEKQPTSQSAAHQKVALIERQVQALHAQRQQLDQELERLHSQLATQKPTPEPVAAPLQPAAPAPVAQVAVPATIKTLPQAPVIRTDLPHVPDIPNVIIGIVKDPRGNVLPNMLVEVKDKDGNPVRAFKTNPLGQFASATPLAPGVYTLELEDPKKIHRFDLIQIAANNQILLPIEVTSHDAREELRKQLFN